ncbi:hypothetical protein GCM10010168_92450 [Actinoplanes ianthinogenes]|uniref:Knr4/Smi1-like domain-containing protein n=1 Tax=Actinoplanes ianthinogenes TaxID=122358 RepID=A0ABM7LJZ2_9ACTN|nr:ADP-ribosylation family protein [Actinoplanes ianthinogenes]BCJ39576.1 hypothetical protein Aiant_02330 [Actinoplanes ianthinogenes]GGR59008.1 hypothetical protein GCM10010168_92450 [Actinoplanes ianthinogenes]
MTDDARRGEALATMLGRFPAVAERVARVYGLRLPRHLAVFAAFWASTRHDPAERAALSGLGLEPWGVTDYFLDGGLDRTGRDGLDERLHGRFRRDPAEFVTVAAGDSDGLHWGLWYDDPAELPTFVVHNYARDSAETWTSGDASMLEMTASVVARAMSDYDGEEAERYRPLIGALDWFAGPDREALAADGPVRWASHPHRWAGSISVFPALPPESGDPRPAEADRRLALFQAGSAEAGAQIADARRELVSGRPALALAVGMELHWVDGDEYRDAGRDLLVDAYRALGRHALADIATIHAANRDLPTAEVLTP